MLKNNTSSFIANAAIIAAVYAALTLILAPISFGVFQIRLSEALCVFSLFTPSAVPGITIGCFLANLIGGGGVWDVVLGSLASLIGCFGMYKLRDRKYIAPLANVLSNGVIVGLMLHHIYGFSSPLICVLLITAEELVPMYALGLSLAAFISKKGFLLK